MDQPEQSWHRLHLWQIQVVRDAVLIAALIIALWLGWLLRGITVPLVIGLFIADLYEPVVRSVTGLWPWLTRTRFVLASAGLALVGVVVAMVVTLPPLAAQTRQLVRDLPLYADKAAQLSERPWVPAMVREQVRAARAALAPRDPLDDGIGSEEPPAPLPVPAAPGRAHPLRALARSGMTVLSAVMGSIAHLMDLAIFLFLVPFFSVLFSIKFPRVRGYLRSLAPESSRPRIAGVVRRMERSVGGFFRGRALVCLILGGAYAVGLTICGVPYGLLLGLLTGACCLIPWLHFIGLPIAWLLLAAHLGDGGALDSWYVVRTGHGTEVLWWRVVVLPLAVWAFAQLLDDYVLSPLIQGQKTDLHPATVVVSILGGGMLAGFYGIIVAVPVVACLKILITEVFVPALRFWTRGEQADPLPLAPAP
jgi:predicted PurR-regulated permease PerM